MATFLFAYRSPKGYEGTDETYGEWMSWFNELGSAVTELGNPIFDRRQVGECRSDVTLLGGYSLISAESLEEAVAFADRCPAVAHGGGVEVGEVTFLGAADPDKAPSAEAAVS
jgi:YCII-related domain-containing protein